MWRMGKACISTTPNKLQITNEALGKFLINIQPHLTCLISILIEQNEISGNLWLNQSISNFQLSFGDVYTRTLPHRKFPFQTETD